MLTRTWDWLVSTLSSLACMCSRVSGRSSYWSDTEIQTVLEWGVRDTEMWPHPLPAASWRPLSQSWCGGGATHWGCPWRWRGPWRGPTSPPATPPPASWPDVKVSIPSPRQPRVSSLARSRPSWSPPLRRAAPPSPQSSSSGPRSPSPKHPAPSSSSASSPGGGSWRSWEEGTPGPAWQEDREQHEAHKVTYDWSSQLEAAGGCSSTDRPQSAAVARGNSLLTLIGANCQQVSTSRPSSQISRNRIQ